MKKYIITLFFTFAINATFSQDLIYTVSGEMNAEKIALDSILVENLTNDTRILFDNLPIRDYYRINLTKNVLEAPVGINQIEKAASFVVAANSPGLITLNYLENNPVDIQLFVYTISGECVYASEKRKVNMENSIQVQLGSFGVFFLKVEAASFSQTFKAIGADNGAGYAVEISEPVIPHIKLKAVELTDNDISFIPGDTIRISVYKNDYFTTPKVLKIESSESVNFLFEENSDAVLSYFTDFRDLTTYKTVTIDGAKWMAQNLAFLPSVNSPYTLSYSEPCYYVNGNTDTVVSVAKSTENYQIYGVLYNWTSAKTACPNGWHLPSYDEWIAFSNYLTNNGFGFEGSGTDIAKSLAAKTNWSDSSSEGTPGNDLKSNNRSGFAGLPGGAVLDHGDNRFSPPGKFCYWWSATQHEDLRTWAMDLEYYATEFFLNSSPNYLGYSVRCIKDK
jgi:uncharacterized protein (TIGR02145 family)